MNPLTQFKNITILHLCIPLTLGCFALSPTAQALNPPPDGDYFNENTAEGQDALFHLISGNGNTAIGFDALFSNTNGAFNTATGFSALSSNITGGYNTANGTNALDSNTTGFENTANGFEALLHNNADFNTANGALALRNNTTGSNNAANGFEALRNNTTGSNNTANGFEALRNNTTGGNNTANGVDALYSNTSGSNNTANGLSALFNNTTGGDNIALGVLAGANLTTGSNNIDIGNLSVAAEANTIRIGKQGTQKATFIAGIIGAPVAGVTVHISGTGQLGIGPPSSARFKEQIKPMDKASQAILALKPVTFRYKPELDPESIPQFGLVAEEVEKVNPDLVARDDQGKVYTVRYEAVNAMLLNEFLKEHRTVQELKSIAARQEATIANQQKQIEALTAGLQKVSAQIQASEPATQMAVNDQ
jgi:trimeric autotransporter adhesin